MKRISKRVLLIISALSICLSAIPTIPYSDDSTIDISTEKKIVIQSLPNNVQEASFHREASCTFVILQCNKP